MMELSWELASIPSVIGATTLDSMDLLPRTQLEQFMAIQYRAVGFSMSLFHGNRSSKPSRIRRGADVALFDDLTREPPENNRKH